MAFFANLICLVSFLAVGGVSIFVWENGNGFGAKLIGSSKGANSDFASICYQNLGKHGLPLWARNGPFHLKTLTK
jgi:hypothetical protein